MIIKTDLGKVTKRWVYKLDLLGLEKSKVGCNEGEDEVVPTVQPPKLIISEETETKTRTYALFSGYPELFRYITNHKREHSVPPSLYEVCPYYMKMHFDIDLSTEGLDEEIIKCRDKVILYPILVAFKDVLETNFPGKFTDTIFVDSLVITESHTLDKISYHIVQDNYFLTNLECKILYEQTKALLVKRSQKLQAESIDPSVYKTNQSFRVFMCCKKNKKNIKKAYSGPELEFGTEAYSRNRLIERLRNKYEKIECVTPIEMKVLAASLISNIITSSRLSMSSQSPAIARHVSSSASRTSRPIDPRDVNAFGMFCKHPLGQSADGSNAFELSYALSGGIIVLNRVKSSRCSLCNRVHDEENVYLKIEMNNDIHYCCRRAQEENPKKGYTTYIANITSLE